MLSILKSDNIVLNIIGNQKKDETKDFRFIKYVVKLESNEDVLIFNTLTRELICIEKERYNTIFNSSNSDCLNQLIEKWFIVPKDFNERALLNNVIQIAKMFYPKDAITNYVIVPTMECNARCFYCFENGARKYSMNFKTADKVVDFIANNSKNQKVNIQWFGGEPLFKNEIIDHICYGLKNKNIRFTSVMISNGYLFDGNIVEKALDLWNLKQVQITLDGTEEIYNKTKNYIYETQESPFKKVINNIEILMNNKIKVSVRLNADKHNFDNLYELVDFLSVKFSNNPYINVYVWLLYDNRGIRTVSSDKNEKNIYVNKLIDLENYIFNKGLFTSTPSKKLKLYACMANMPFSTTILPDGSLGKCDHYTDGGFWGNINSDEKNIDNISSWNTLLQDIKLCEECQLKPQCLTLDRCPDKGEYDCDSLVKLQKLNKLRLQMMNVYRQKGF